MDNPQGRLIGAYSPVRTLRDFTFRLDVMLQVQWIVGFVDGEGCFHVGINRNEEMSLGFQVLPEFTVVQHKRDVQILHQLKTYFGCGVVRTNHGDRMAYRVRGHDHLRDIILPFFLKHPLKTKKNIDFLKFRDVVLMMDKGVHLTGDGLEKIRGVAAQMNRQTVR